MKKLTTLVIFLILLPQIVICQETESSAKNVIKTNTLSLLVGTGTVFYEREITDNFSSNLGIGYLNYTFGETFFSGIILTPEFRFYPKKDAIDGFYMAPYFRFQSFQLGIDNNSAGYNNFGGGFLFGHQWITKSGFSMDLFFGGHYSEGKIILKSDYDSFKTNLFEGFKIRLGFAIGFAF